MGHEEVEQSYVRVNKKQEINTSEKGRKGNRPDGNCNLADKETKVETNQ